jgi:hypothetical protein
MYVRWQTYKRRSAPDDLRVSAVLVESKRINGRPVQRHIAFLGSFYVRHRNDPRLRWRRFWRGEVFNSTIAALASKVDGPPTVRERARLDRQHERMLGELTGSIRAAL